MTSEDLNDRLAKEPVTVECPICRHRQWMRSTPGRCDQCGSEIAIYETRPAARAALEALVAEGRVAYLDEIAGEDEAGRGLFAVVANRTFRRPER